MNIANWLTRVAQVRGEAPAVFLGRDPVADYAGFCARAAGLAGWLQARGVVPGDESVPDVMFGESYLYRFNNRWDANLRADYSLGDSEGTWNLIGGISFRFTDLFAMNLGYRHASLEYEETVEGESNTTTIELSGPLLGFLFRF